MSVLSNMVAMPGHGDLQGGWCDWKLSFKMDLSELVEI